MALNYLYTYCSLSALIASLLAARSFDIISCIHASGLHRSRVCRFIYGDLVMMEIFQARGLALLLLNFSAENSRRLAFWLVSADVGPYHKLHL